jgi:hypothetical protein
MQQNCINISQIRTGTKWLLLKAENGKLQRYAMAFIVKFNVLNHFVQKS